VEKLERPLLYLFFSKKRRGQRGLGISLLPAMPLPGFEPGFLPFSTIA